MYLARFTEEECHDQIGPTTTSSSASEESLERQREKEGEQWRIIKGTQQLTIESVCEREREQGRERRD